jgi:putative ABC transport system substrate-binding protein
MRRREFITLLGAAAAVWPLAAHTQQRERVRRIGVLTNRAADDPDGQAGFAGFLQGCRKRGGPWAATCTSMFDGTRAMPAAFER